MENNYGNSLINDQNYYLLDLYASSKDLHIADVVLDEENYKLIKSGVSLVNTFNEIEVIIKNIKGPPNDFLLYASYFPVVSERLKDYLLNLEFDKSYLEFIPVSFRKKIKTPYYFMNILQKIDAIDYKKSEYTVWPDYMGSNAGKINKILKLILNDKVIAGRNIFRIIQGGPYIIVSKKFALDIEKQGFTGYRIAPLDRIS
jgi:hypothetical protein